MARGHVWQRGMHGRGACIAVGCAWQGGVHGRYYEIWSMSGRYASYWNAFLFESIFDFVNHIPTNAACIHPRLYVISIQLGIFHVFIALKLQPIVF